ncbi:hypothetical protein XELAEV_18009253mg [Xenopus laevis]|uniref:Uncharacterized protein n=1 Tax=Xenopus laevis TaxID=8355 RepID=A0A974DSB3_XENLA|nr:hypothetical protein XELAEV_18009253mg [Xenopus laevis]
MANYFVYHHANFQQFVRQDYRPLIVKNDYEEIINQARSEWSQEVNKKLTNATVYAGEYGQKQLDGTTHSKMRPSSPTRKNNPHPPTDLYDNQAPQPATITEKRTLAKSGNSSLYLQHKDLLNSKKNKLTFIKTIQNPFHRKQCHSPAVSCLDPLFRWFFLLNPDCAAVQKMMDFVTENHEKYKEIPDKRRLLCQKEPVWRILINTLSTVPNQQETKERSRPLTLHGAENIVHPEWRTHIS